jgi:hypothetical protein
MPQFPVPPNDAGPALESGDVLSPVVDLRQKISALEEQIERQEKRVALLSADFRSNELLDQAKAALCEMRVNHALLVAEQAMGEEMKQDNTKTTDGTSR